MIYVFFIFVQDFANHSKIKPLENMAKTQMI